MKKYVLALSLLCSSLYAGDKLGPTDFYETYRVSLADGSIKFKLKKPALINVYKRKKNEMFEVIDNMPVYTSYHKEGDLMIAFSGRYTLQAVHME